jgi:hypothetical protein
MSEFVDYCSMCGVALTTEEVATLFEGSVVFFLERRTGTLTMTFCADCTNKMMELMESGMDGAISRRIALEGQEPIFSSSELKRRYIKRKFKDEDGDGGVANGIPPA